MMIRFWRKYNIEIASAQKDNDKWAKFNIKQATSTRILLRLSTTPFCCGVYGVDNLRFIDFEIRNSVNVVIGSYYSLLYIVYFNIFYFIFS